ncbi:MAG: Fic family protein [Candidatus Eremiobacteraeota bacterium]|nr:Fic family protein [Candidatus Eremiobacteraeota bacterium]
MRNLILEELSDALDDRSGQFRYFFVVPAGRVEPYAADDPLALEASVRRDALAIHPLSHADAHQLVVDFISTLSDGALAEKLRGAVAGAAPSGRFLQVLRAYPRARRSWLSYRARRLEAIALEWLREHGVDIGSLGLDRPARAQEDATGLRFDPSLDERLEHVRARALAFAASPFAASARAECRHAMRIDEIYHSNAVRGNRLTREQTEELVVRGTTVGALTLREHLEAVNLNRALDRAEQLALADAPLTEHGIRELHACLFASIDDENAGLYRRIDTRLVGRDYLPPESVLVPALLREFTEWLEETGADPVARATAAQAKILSISPFLDGNGRVGRLLSNLILCAADYPQAIVRLEDSARYYDGLRQSDGGDMSILLGLMIDRVEASLVQLEAALTPR